MINVIGLGPGNLELITDQGKSLIYTSEVLIGGKRNLESIVGFQGETIELGNNLQEVIDYIKKYSRTKQISIIASGDPLIYGIGKYLIERIPREELCIVPGISAIQYMFSRIPLDMNDVYMTSSHGKEPNFDKLLSYEKVAMVTDQTTGPGEIAAEILKRGMRKKMWVGENLSYPNEYIREVQLEEIIGQKFQMNVVVIQDEK